MKIVGIGGGTGLPVLLRGLKELRDRQADGPPEDRVSTAAIVCVSDDGGSSGTLRHAFGIPAVGDLRNCLVALSSGNPALRDVFQFRLNGDSGLHGHALGNLIVAALRERAGNFRHAVRLASEILGLQGDVLPCTEVSVTLCAEFLDGEIGRGETNIASKQKRIRRIWLDPPDAPAGTGVVDTLLSADAIVLGPGSLHTSIIPNLLPAGIADAVWRSPALKILICNLMTQPGETESYSAADHARTILKYLGAGALHMCLLNSRPVPSALAAQYAATGAAPVWNDCEALEQLGVAPISMDLLAQNDRKVAHDSMKLARWVVALTRAYQRTREMHAGELRCLATSSAEVAVEAAG